MPDVLAPNGALPLTAWRKRARDAITNAGDMKPDDWRGLISGMLQLFGEEMDEPEHAGDAAPQTLYVHRPLLNADDVIEWAKAAGFATTLKADDMHVTLAFSRSPVDRAALSPDDEDHHLDAGTTRSLKRLGDDGKAVVLAFKDSELEKRWQQFCDAGASWDYSSFHPHVTISYKADGIEIADIEPYDGPLDFGPEVFGEVKANASKGIAEDAMPLALDKSTFRHKDADGHLHILRMNISKATVNPYRGTEIPMWEELGLDPEKIYYLLRHPDELAKGAATANGKPILREHVGTTADDHQGDEVIGAMGREATFEHPYLTNSAVFWPAADIDDIESESKREVSMGYRYIPIMTPGTYEGEHFDGIMTNIEVNHLALVEEGRAGSDVCVPDEAMDAAQWRAIERAILDMGEA